LAEKHFEKIQLVGVRENNSATMIEREYGTWERSNLMSQIVEKL